MNSITFQQAIDLFKLPKILGDYEKQEVIVANGRYGPYIRFGKMFVSLDKGEDPMKVNLNRAVELIQSKRKADAPVRELQ